MYTVPFFSFSSALFGNDLASGPALGQDVLPDIFKQNSGAQKTGGTGEFQEVFLNNSL